MLGAVHASMRTASGRHHAAANHRPQEERALSKRLRIGLLLDSLDVPAWVWVAIREVTQLDVAELAVIVLKGDAPAPGTTPVARRARAVIGRLLVRLDALSDRRIPAKHDALRPRDARPMLTGVPSIRVDPASPDDPETFAAEDVERLRALDLDVLLQFGFPPLRGAVLDVARSGAWAFTHADAARGDAGPIGFWEVHDVEPVTAMTLRMLANDESGGVVLAQATSTTVPTSIRRNRNALYWKVLPMLPRALRRLHSEGDRAFRANLADHAPAAHAVASARSPSPADVAVHATRRFGRLLSIAGRVLLKRQQWVLFYALGDDLVTDGARLRSLIPPSDRFWADPHVVHVGDRYFVFVEELAFASGKGHIAVLEIDAAGRASGAHTVLEEAHHLSYPFVFEHEGDFYMIPESAEQRTIDLYRATAFPDQWTLVEHLMTDVQAVDTTLVRERDRWWMFAGITAHRGANSGELHLFSSDRLIGGTWRMHPASPLSSDVRNSRPAGAILRREGRLVRPGQDGSGAYGRAIRLHEIVELTDDAYEEREVAVIEATWDPRITRTHTIAHVDRLTVLDALWPRWRWSANPPRPERGRPG